MKYLKFLSLISVLVLPLSAHTKSKTPQDLFDYLTNSSEKLTMHCSLKGITFSKKCRIKADYIGSTMGDAITVYFPNGKKADYRVHDYEKKTLFGLNDDNATYQLKSTPSTLDIYRNHKSWIKLWKAQ